MKAAASLPDLFGARPRFIHCLGVGGMGRRPERADLVGREQAAVGQLSRELFERQRHGRTSTRQRELQPPTLRTGCGITKV